VQVFLAHRGWLGATAALTFALALAWGLLRFGAAETSALYRLFLFLLVPSFLVLLDSRLHSQTDWRMPTVAIVGLFLLGQVVIQPTLEARGYLHLSVGWIALWISLALAWRSDRLVRFLLGALVLLGLFEAFYGLAQSVGGFDYIGSYFRGRGRVASGTLINRNHFAALLNLMLPLALGLLVANQAMLRSPRATRSESLAKIWIALLGCAVMGAAVLMSQSRGGTIAFVMTLLFMAMLLGFGRRALSSRVVSGAALAVLLFQVVGMGAAFGLEALLERFGRLDENLPRVEVYQNTLNMIGDEWILGVGPGMYRWRFPRYQTVDSQKLYDHAHNDFLESAAEWGVLLALLGWGLVFWRLYRSSVVAISTRDPWTRGLAIGCAGALFSILMHSLVDFSLQLPAVLMVFGCVLGWSWALESPAAVRSRLAVQATPLILRLLLAVALLAAGWQTLARSQALDATRPENGVPGLERAVSIDHDSPEPHFLLAMAYRDLPGAGDVERATSEFESATRLNPYAARYWLEYSRLQELRGETERAEASLRVALALSPADAKLRWQLANLLLRRGDQEAAAEELAGAVEVEPLWAEPAVSLLSKSGAPAERVLALLPDDQAASIHLLRWMVSTPGLAAPESLMDTLWAKVLASPDPLTIPEGRTVVDSLFRQGRLTASRNAWLELTRANGIVDKSFEAGQNRVWNGDFESALSDRPFGWHVGRADFFSVERIAGQGQNGSTGLGIEFLGTENRDFAHVSQQLILEPRASYRLQVALRAEGITTDQGIFIELTSKDPNGVLASTDAVVGTTGWQVFEAQFVTPPGSGQAEIRLRRRVSQQIDNQIRGKVWVDSVGIEQVLP
jgi:tetratricopeptide (TPR) repeat protein